MSFITTTAPAEASGEVRAMYERQQDHWGFIPNYAKVFSGRPKVLARWGRLLAEIRRPMTRRRFELATFAASLALRNTGCALAHGRALAEFYTEEQVRALAAGEPVDSMPEVERHVFEFAQRVARDATSVTWGEVARLREHGLDDDEIFDIAAAAAGRAFFTKLLDALGTEPDSAYLALDAEFRHAMTVGRPIAFEPAERL